MFRKISFKTILIIFAGLLALVIITHLIDRSKGNRSFKNELSNLNPDEIDHFELCPGTATKEAISLKKTGENWQLQFHNKTYNADRSVVESVINNAAHLKASSIASTNKKRWAHYQVNDSLSTHLRVFSGNQLKADLDLGKTSYSNQQQTTYIRVSGEPATYGIQGIQASGLKHKADDFKDKTVIKSNKNDWDKLTFSYPADSSFVLEKLDKKWSIPQIHTDSAKVASFLSSIQNLKHYKFGEPDKQENPVFSLTIEGKNLQKPIKIDALQEKDGKLLIASNQNPGLWFDGSGLKEKIFPPELRFVSNK